VANEDFLMHFRWRVLVIAFAAGVALASPTLSYFVAGSSFRPDFVQKHAARPSRGRTRTWGNQTPHVAAAQIGVIAPPPRARFRSPLPLWFGGALLSAGHRSLSLSNLDFPGQIPLRC
jgi:hypothetical protein